MYQIVYTSSACSLFSKDQLIELLQVSRSNNSAHQITGMLVYKDGTFLQVLEGPEESVKQTYDKILQDSRHKGSLLLLRGEKDERDFPEWTMGFRDLASAELGDIEGFDQFMNAAVERGADEPNLPRAIKLLKSFKRTM